MKIKKIVLFIVLQMKWREIEAAVFNKEDIEFEGEEFQDFTGNYTFEFPNFELFIST